MMDFLIQKVYAQAPYRGFTDESVKSPGFTDESSSFHLLLKKILDNVVNPIILLLMALAVLYFLYGVFVFIKNADNPTEREVGYQSMIWGIIGVFIMISAVGLKNIIATTIGLPPGV
jgi:uncharacterized membrane protein